MEVNRQLSYYYGSIAFLSSILHNVFLLYHVETFVSVYKIDKTSFWIGETIFLVWNSCNDPLFGWLSDKHLLTKSSGSNGSIVLKRINSLQWNGALFALSFVAFWGAWTYPALQFVVCLCLYDSFLTMVDLHHSALLADLAVSADTRTHLNFYSSLFSALGSFSVFLSYVAWNRKDHAAFQMFCVCLAVISLCGFIFCTKQLRKHYCKHMKKDELEQVSWSDNTRHATDSVLSEAQHEKEVLKGFVKELAGHPNFVWFAAMNLVQVFHCHFNSNFFPLFLDHLLGDSIPQVICSLILGVSFIAPHINNLYFLGLCRRYGVYVVVRWLFYIKLGLALVMLIAGPNHLWLLCVYIASNRVFTEGTCKLLTLVISDLVDEDYVIHGRKQAVSALIFGTTALVSKPGQTLAPLVGTWLLALQTGHDVFESGNLGESLKLDVSTMTQESQQVYREGVFYLLVYIPIACALIQLVVWSKFTLKGQRLQWIKSLRQGAPYATL